jgi:hypothetical protein
MIPDPLVEFSLVKFFQFVPALIPGPFLGKFPVALPDFRWRFFAFALPFQVSLDSG